MTDKATGAPAEPLQDRPAQVEVGKPEVLAAGFRRYERFPLTLTHPDGSSDVMEREIVRAGRVVGVLPFDPGRDELVMIRQFRLPAHLGTGNGEMVEVVAGIVEPSEDLAAAAGRECAEEIGLAPSRLIPMVRYFPAPGVTDEMVTIFLGIVDAAVVPERAGAPEEGEATFPFAVPVATALEALAAGRLTNGITVMALHWLALNRDRIATLVAAPQD